MINALIAAGDRLLARFLPAREADAVICGTYYCETDRSYVGGYCPGNYYCQEYCGQACNQLTLVDSWCC
jgi:hypothetical protein